MSKSSNSSPKNSKSQEIKRSNNEQVLASLMALPVVAIDQDTPLQDIKLQAKNKASGLIDFDGEKELTELESLVVDPVGATELALGDEALTDLALIEDSEYSNASKKEDDDDGVAWWLKGLALLGGGAAAFAGGGGGGGGGSPTADTGPAEAYDHSSFIDALSGGDGDDVLVLDSDLTVANLTLIAPENEQTFNTSGGSGGLLDETANSQYVFVGEDSGARTLNLRVSDEDNIALGLLLDADLDSSGGYVYSESEIENVNILVDSGSILRSAEDFVDDDLSGGINVDDIIHSHADGRSLSIEVIEGSSLYAEDSVIQVEGSNNTITVDMTDSYVGDSGGFDGPFDLGGDAGVVDFVRVDAYDQIDTETTVIDATFTDSELSLDDDLIDFNGEKLDVTLQLTSSLVAAQDSILEVDSSRNDVIASVGIEDSTVVTQYGNFIDIHDAKNLDLTLTIDSSFIINELAYAAFVGFSGGGVLEDLDLITDVSLINVDAGPLTNLDIDLSATSSILLLNENFIEVSTNQTPVDSESTISMTFDSVFALSGDDAISVEKNQADIDVNLHYSSGYYFLGYEEPVPVSITFIGDDFIDLVGDDSVINVNLSDRPIGDLGEAGDFQAHFISDDFIDITGRDAQVTFNIEDNSAIILGADSTGYLATIDGPGAHTVNITMSDDSVITNGEDFVSGGYYNIGTSGGFFGSGGDFDDNIGLVQIDNDHGTWDGSNDAVVNVTLSDNAIIDALNNSSSATDLIWVDSSNAKVSVTLNDSSDIYTAGDLISVNTNLYNEANYSEGYSDISLVINDEAEVGSNGSLITVEYENEYYVGEDLNNQGNSGGLGYAASTTVSLTIDGGESSGGAYADASVHLIYITDGDGREAYSNTVSRDSLDRNVNLTVSNADVYSDNDSIRLYDLIGFNVHADITNDSYLESGDALIQANDVDDSYVDLNINGSYIWLTDNDFEDSLVFLDNSDDLDIVINIEDSQVDQDTDTTDTVSIFSGEDSNGLNVNITIENMSSGEDYLQVVDVHNVDNSEFYVNIYESVGVDELLFDMGNNFYAGTFEDKSSNNMLDIRLIDATGSGGSLLDVYIDTVGWSGNNFGTGNTVNLTLQETNLDELYVDQSYFTDTFNAGYVMSTTIDLESSSINDLGVTFEDLSVSGGGNKQAELYLNLNNSDIEQSVMDVYGLDNVDLYTQGTASSFIQLDVNLMEDVDNFNGYSLGNSNFDFQINYSTTNDIAWVTDNSLPEFNVNTELSETEINLAEYRDGGARNYDYLDIEYFEMAQVNNFETVAENDARRDMIYNDGDFTVIDLDFDIGSYSGGGVNTSTGDDYYFSNLSLVDLLNDLYANSGGSSLGEQIESDNGAGNTYYVINGPAGSNDDDEVQIYRWVDGGVDSLHHVMTINGMNVSNAVDEAAEFENYITSNPYHTVMGG